jgi:hypothetical protein
MTTTKTWHPVHRSSKANLARGVCRGCPSFLVGAWVGQEKSPVAGLEQVDP